MRYQRRENVLRLVFKGTAGLLRLMTLGLSMLIIAITLGTDMEEYLLHDKNVLIIRYGEKGVLPVIATVSLLLSIALTMIWIWSPAHTLEYDFGFHLFVIGPMQIFNIPFIIHVTVQCVSMSICFSLTYILLVLIGLLGLLNGGICLCFGWSQWLAFICLDDDVKAAIEKEAKMYNPFCAPRPPKPPPPKGAVHWRQKWLDRYSQNAQYYLPKKPHRE